jgi:hypothetical protein
MNFRSAEAAIASGSGKKRLRVSYSFREPEDPAICECKYNEANDRMDREDCPFHASLVEDAQGHTPEMGALCKKRKGPEFAERAEPLNRSAKTA